MIRTNYYIISGISILLLCVNLLHLSELELISKKSIVRFRLLIYFIITEITVDLLFNIFEGNSNVPKMALYLLKAFELSMNPVMPFLIFRLFNGNATSTNKAIKWFVILFRFIIYANICLQIASIFFNTTFYIDENNMYQRNGLIGLYVAILVASTILMVLSMHTFSKMVQNSNALTLCGIFVMIITGIVLRKIFIETNFDWLCISISAVFIDIYFVDLGLRLDPLTQLLNRQVYSTRIEKINYSTIIFMIDANNFKSINDKYGHECGDKTLQSLAKCIFKAYGQYGWCFRIGGDEFCVILKPKAIKTLIEKEPRSDIYCTAEKLMGKLDDIIQARASKEQHNCLQYGVSQGFGIYYYPSDYPSIENKMPLEKVIKLADIRMYRNKKIFKEKNAILDDNPVQYEEQNAYLRANVIYEDVDPELVEKK